MNDYPRILSLEITTNEVALWSRKEITFLNVFEVLCFDITGCYGNRLGLF